MKKIKDRMVLGLIAGGAGVLLQTIFDEISVRVGISKRSYRTTAAGIWVSSRRQAEKWQGQLFGFFMNSFLAMLGGISIVNIFSKSGRDHWLIKGLYFGMTFGAIINGLLSSLPMNKVKPKDANSNLSYLFTNALYGLAVGTIAAKLGDDSIYDAKPQNNYLKPTELTTEQSNVHKLAAK
ncbi:MAG: hypothetical protein M0T74_12935 [Desulfitobacterium hafniense]|nr:hypothetical protein [Desulfitobacterium hafniense]